jgi:hypothetical protein
LRTAPHQGCDGKATALELIHEVRPPRLEKFPEVGAGKDELIPLRFERQQASVAGARAAFVRAVQALARRLEEFAPPFEKLPAVARTARNSVIENDIVARAASTGRRHQQASDGARVQS